MSVHTQQIFPKTIFASPVLTMKKWFFHRLPKTCQPWSNICSVIWSESEPNN